METTPQKKLWPWVVGGCILLVLIACTITFAVGAGGILIASQAAKRTQGESNRLPAKMTAKTAALQNMQGRVEVESDKGDWSPAMENQLIEPGQHVRTGKLSGASLVFADKSKTLLKADSEIAIDELNAEADGNPRVIVLTQVAGESKHQVTPNKRSDARYEVRTPSGVGTAKGTEFQVVVTPQQTAYFYVTEGVVAVNALETTVLINPGFMTILYFDQPPLAPVQSILVEGFVSQAGKEWTVAGTTFATNENTVIVGNPQVGDWVMVKGHLGEDDQKIADWIILERKAFLNQFSLTGKVEAISASEWKINGQAVAISETTDLDEGIQVGDTVFVEGWVETGGTLHADKIERLDEGSGLPFTFTGMVEKIVGSAWVISGIQIKTDEKSVISPGLEVGDLVEVKGHILADGTWLAEEIKPGTGDLNEFSITGKLESIDPWKVAGVPFETRDYTVAPSDLKIGELVRVEGQIDAEGKWVATKIVRIAIGSGARMVIIGIVFSMDPWVVSGIPLTLAPDAMIVDNITVGMLVRVELVLLPDGAWQAVKIEPIQHLIWFPGCMDVIVTVVRLDGDHLYLLDWPVLTIPDGTEIEGQLTPDSVIRMRVCFDDVMVIKVVYIIVIVPGPGEPPVGEEGGKVTVCHKPDKKGGHTLSIGRSALPAHLGHGDYEGACR